MFQRPLIAQSTGFLSTRFAKPSTTKLFTPTLKTFSTTTTPPQYTLPTSKYQQSTLFTQRRKAFSTTTTPPPQQPTTATTTTTTATEATIEEPPQTWKNPIVFALDAIVAGGLTYVGIQSYNFLFDQPEIINVMFNQAQQSPFLIENLGTPLKRDWIWWGTCDDYSARVDFGISGPKGSGKIEGKAFKVQEDRWELIYLYGALPEFENRLTDLLPVDEDLLNTMPYIPDPNDPSAAHALTGAPALPFTSANKNDEQGEVVLLPNPAYGSEQPANTVVTTTTTTNNNPALNPLYVPFEKGENYEQWTPEPVDQDGDADNLEDRAMLMRKPRDFEVERQVAANITKEHLAQLEEYNNLTVAPKDKGAI